MMTQNFSIWSPAYCVESARSCIYLGIHIKGIPELGILSWYCSLSITISTYGFFPTALITEKEMVTYFVDYATFAAVKTGST